MRNWIACSALLSFALSAEESFEARIAKYSPAARELVQVWDKKAERPVDARHLPPRTLHEGSGFVPPVSKDAWSVRAKWLREQVLMAAGLWPLLEPTPLETVIHGKIERDGYTIEKVFFQSYPGFYVSGNLYRPAHIDGKVPGILVPHGHWENGRFQFATEKVLQKEVAGGWEKDEKAARYHFQALCVGLARLGCVAFHYDMVGYADADPERFPHRKTWLGTDAELRGLGVLGLQLRDSMQALTFLQSLPDVDSTRLACTGASGGATQTFLLMATDDRLTCAAPVCMISAGEHQGGCVCENSALLRVFTDNVELAATFAPKPFIHPTATGDWTKDFMEKGFPEIQRVYRLFGAEDNVAAFRQEAGHNYNVKSREAVYNFFDKHFELGHQQPILEKPFEPVKPAELSVFDAEHPRPSKALDSVQLKKYLEDLAAHTLQELAPIHEKRLQLFRKVVGTALSHMCMTELPPPENVAAEIIGTVTRANFTAQRLFISRKSGPEKIPAVLYLPAAKTATLTIVAMPGGKAALVAPDGSFLEPLNALFEKGQAVLALDLFESGENTQVLSGYPRVDRNLEFFAGYNRTILAQRVHDLLTAAAWAKHEKFTTVNLCGTGAPGTACLLAGALSPDAFARVAVDADSFDFATVTDNNDERFLPSALKFGGLWPLAALRAPGELFVVNSGAALRPAIMEMAYRVAGSPEHFAFLSKGDAKTLVEWIAHP